LKACPLKSWSTRIRLANEREKGLPKRAPKVKGPADSISVYYAISDLALADPLVGLAKYKVQRIRRYNVF
jgi:hypothetical protein